MNLIEQFNLKTRPIYCFMCRAELVSTDISFVDEDIKLTLYFCSHECKSRYVADSIST